MAKRNGNRAALLSSALGMLILAATVWILRHRLMEEWYIYGLKSSRHEDVKQVALRLGDLGTVRAIPDLIDAFRRSIFSAQGFGAGFGDGVIHVSETPEILQSIIRISLRGGPGSKRVLKQALEDENELVRSAAAFAIIFAESDADEESIIRIWGWSGDRSAIVEIVAIGRKAIPALIRALDDRSPYLRRIAADSLGEFHRWAQPAVPALQKLLDDPDPAVRAAVESALKGIGAGGEEPAE